MLIHPIIQEIKKRLDEMIPSMDDEDCLLDPRSVLLNMFYHNYLSESVPLVLSRLSKNLREVGSKQVYIDISSDKLKFSIDYINLILNPVLRTIKYEVEKEISQKPSWEHRSPKKTDSGLPSQNKETLELFLHEISSYLSEGIFSPYCKRNNIHTESDLLIHIVNKSSFVIDIILIINNYESVASFISFLKDVQIISRFLGFWVFTPTNSQTYELQKEISNLAAARTILLEQEYLTSENYLISYTLGECVEKCFNLSSKDSSNNKGARRSILKSNSRKVLPGGIEQASGDLDLCLFLFGLLGSKNFPCVIWNLKDNNISLVRFLRYAKEITLVTQNWKYEERKDGSANNIIEYINSCSFETLSIFVSIFLESNHISIDVNLNILRFICFFFELSLKGFFEGNFSKVSFAKSERVSFSKAEVTQLIKDFRFFNEISNAYALTNKISFFRKAVEKSYSISEEKKTTLFLGLDRIEEDLGMIFENSRSLKKMNNKKNDLPEKGSEKSLSKKSLENSVSYPNVTLIKEALEKKNSGQKKGLGKFTKVYSYLSPSKLKLKQLNEVVFNLLKLISSVVFPVSEGIGLVTHETEFKTFFLKKNAWELLRDEIDFLEGENKEIFFREGEIGQEKLSTKENSIFAQIEKNGLVKLKFCKNGTSDGKRGVWKLN